MMNESMTNILTPSDCKFNNEVPPKVNSNINNFTADADASDVLINENHVNDTNVGNSNSSEEKLMAVMQTSPVVKEEKDRTPQSRGQLPKMIEAGESIEKTEDCNCDGSIINTTNSQNKITYAQNQSETVYSLGQSHSNHCLVKEMTFGTDQLQKGTYETFNNTNMFRLRIHLLEIIEEIKIRRLVDKENEERIKRLMTENHELNLKCENALEQVYNINDSKESSLTALKKEHQNKISNMELVQHKLQLTIDYYMKECKHLKDELQCIQMAKYSMEKEMKEQERRIQLRDSLGDTSITQLAALEIKCKDVVRKMDELKENHSRLEKNVKEACKLNNQLNYLIDHHNCEINWYKSQITMLQDSLTKANIALEGRPHEADLKMKETEQTYKKLEQKLEFAEASVQRLEVYLEQNKEELAMMESQMKTSNDLILRLEKQISQKTEEIRNLQTSLAEVTESHHKLKTLYDLKNKELEEERNDYLKKEHQWTKQKEAMEDKLSSLQNDHQTLLRAHNNLEELNTKWALKNTALTQENNTLKEQLFKCKNDKEVQTFMDTGIAAIQTEMLCTSSLCLQTEVFDMCSIAIQTENNDNIISINSANLTCRDDQMVDMWQKSVLCETYNKQTNDVTISIYGNDKQKQQFQLHNKISDGQQQPAHNALEISSVQIKPTSTQISQKNELVNSYNTFTSTLKTIASMFTAGHPSSVKNKEDDKDKCTLKRKISECLVSAASRNETTGNQIQSTVPTILYLAKEESTLSTEGSKTGVEKQSSILLDPNKACKRHKRVTFCEQLEYRCIPPTDAANSDPTSGKEILFCEDESELLENQIEEVTKYLDIDQLPCLPK